MAENAAAAPLELTGRVVDAAEVLTAAEETALTAELRQIETDTLAQLVVVTTPTLGGQSIDDYSLALGNSWGIGHRDRDDGMLIVVAPNERKVRIEVGYGLEARVPDPYAAGVIDSMTPHFGNGDWHAGISTGVEQLGERLRETVLEQAA